MVYPNIDDPYLIESNTFRCYLYMVPGALVTWYRGEYNKNVPFSGCCKLDTSAPFLSWMEFVGICELNSAWEYTES